MINFNQVAPSVGVIIFSMEEYNGKLYGAGTNRGLLEWNGVNAWVPLLSGSGDIESLRAFNGNLYGSTNANLIEWDGVSGAWSTVASAISGETDLWGLLEYGSELYGGSGLFSAELWKWNGVNAWVQVAPQLGSETRIFSTILFNGKIYGTTFPLGNLYEWNGVNAWVQVAPQLNGQLALRSLAVYNGKLYGGTSLGGRLFEWNGVNAWVQVAPQLGTANEIRSLEEYNGVLYAGTDDGKLYSWNDVDSWVEEANSGISTTLWLLPFDGNLYAGAFTGELFEITGLPLPSSSSSSSSVNLTVNVTANPGSGLVPLTTTIQSQVLTGEAVIWEVDFGDGSTPVIGHTNVIPDQVHEYSSPGVYIVTLTAKDSIGTTTTDSIRITVARVFKIFSSIYVDLNRTTDGHAGTFRDNFSYNDLEDFFIYLSVRTQDTPLTEQITFKVRGRTNNNLTISDIIGDGVGANKNLLRFESTDPVNDPAILVSRQHIVFPPSGSTSGQSVVTRTYIYDNFETGFDPQWGTDFTSVATRVMRGGDWVALVMPPQGLGRGSYAQNEYPNYYDTTKPINLAVGDFELEMGIRLGDSNPLTFNYGWVYAEDISVKLQVWDPTIPDPAFGCKATIAWWGVNGVDSSWKATTTPSNVYTTANDERIRFYADNANDPFGTSLELSSVYAQFSINALYRIRLIRVGSTITPQYFGLAGVPGPTGSWHTLGSYVATYAGPVQIKTDGADRHAISYLDFKADGGLPYTYIV